ncbi:tetratricopeptide repeat protein [Rufibacter sp. LB8]|uniref:tetratricopeptide repeat protein n=1 Tax=Rufibacter sp. LB8 TaxID=2777781 RepID=UPI00178C82DB|nr:tetratricopeptide repeat protein [Rufibacter sp. LB8]
MRFSLWSLYALVLLSFSCTEKVKEGERMFSMTKVDSSVPTQIAELTKALEQGNDRPEWYLKRARLYLAQNLPKEALVDINQAIAQDKDLGEAYFLKAGILLQRGDYQGTRQMMAQAQTYNYYTPESEAILAETYVALKQYDQALGHSSKAIALSPGQPKYYVLLARAQAGTGDTTKALVNLERALQQDSTSLPAYKELSAIYTARQQFDLAIPYVQAGVKRQPQQGFWWHHLGEFYLSQRLTDTAMACFTKAIDLEPDSPQPHAGLAKGWYKKRQYSAALQHFQKAQELGLVLDDATRYLLATTLEWTGNREVARTHYVFLYRKNPQNPRYSVALQRTAPPRPRVQIDSLPQRTVF